MKTILIVEDEKDIAEMLSVFLENEGYRTVTAGDGLEGLGLFARERVDLVILDVLLPKLDGFSLCKKIREKSDVPVIMLTALSDEDSQLKGYDLMIDEYVTKPFTQRSTVEKSGGCASEKRRAPDGAFVLGRYFHGQEKPYSKGKGPGDLSHRKRI